MVLDSLDRIMTGSVAMTAMALSASPLRDLTLLQWRVLVVTDHGMRVTAIAAAVQMSVPSASKIVRRLARAGFVEVERGVVDERVRLVVLTPVGILAVDDVRRRRRELADQALQRAAVVIDAPFDSQLALLAEAFLNYR